MWIYNKSLDLRIPPDEVQRVHQRHPQESRKRTLRLGRLLPPYYTSKYPGQSYRIHHGNETRLTRDSSTASENERSAANEVTRSTASSTRDSRPSSSQNTRQGACQLTSASHKAHQPAPRGRRHYCSHCSTATVIPQAEHRRLSQIISHQELKTPKEVERIQFSLCLSHSHQL
ncbi:hypothetical protein BDZ45DRAFT_182752 [Acephala macrosclerotiorum]|nr:hypothetical protein BDZ45DRAFT_182752 [Acephala macrosclerotiorum]